MKHQKEDQGSLSISESWCQEGFCSIDFIEEKNDISPEAHKEN